MARSSNSKKAINEGDDGATTISTDTFSGSGFQAGYVGYILSINSGVDRGKYLISSVSGTTQMVVTTLDGDPVSFSATASDLDYSVLTSENNISGFFSDVKKIPTGLMGQPWRFSSTLISSEWDFTNQGVFAGDVLVVEVTRTDLNLVSNLYLHVVGVDRDRLSFVFNRDDLEDGTSAGGLSVEMQEALADDLQVTGLNRDLQNQIQYTLEAELVKKTVTSAAFKRKYFETELNTEKEIDLGAFSIKLKPTKVIRNTKMKVDEDLISAPMLQEYIRQPDLGKVDGELQIIGRDGSLYPIDHEPYVLVENQDFIIDDESQITGFANITQNVDEIEIPRGDLVDRRVAPGDLITLTVGSTVQKYTVRKVLDSENVRVFPTPSETKTTIPFELQRGIPGKFIRFVEGSFTKDKPAPKRLWAEVSFFSNDANIEANFGTLVGLSRTDLVDRSVNVPYKSAVEGLMFALTNGPVVENMRLAAQILLGLPFAENKGVVIDIEPNFRIREDGSPLFGRILIEGRDKDNNPTGVTNAYLYPQGRQLADPDNPGEWLPATPNEAGLAINPDTEEEYKIGDEVAQFAVLSKGVIAKDYLSDPDLADALLEQGSLGSFVKRFHSFQLRINADIATPADVNLAAEFIKKAKPHYIDMSAGTLKIIEDFVEIEDALIFGLLRDLFDGIGYSLPGALKFDQAPGNDEFIIVDGSMYVPYKRGDDLETTQGSNQVESPSGGFNTPGTLESFDTPFLRSGDILKILEGNNAGEYPLVSVDSDTQITVTFSGQFETLDDQRFQVLRKVENPIFTTTGISVNQSSSTINIGSGGISAGVAVGDILTFTDDSGTNFYCSRKYQIVEFNKSNDQVTVIPAVEETSGTYDLHIWRDGLIPKYFLNAESDTPFDADITSGSQTISFNMPGSDLSQLAYLNPGDQVVDGDNVFTVLDWRPNTLEAVCIPAPSYTSAGTSVKIIRPYRASTPISFDLIDRVPDEELILDLRLPSADKDLVTTASSPTVTSDSSEDWEALGFEPGDFFIILEGGDSVRDIGYGDGVFPIAKFNGPSSVDLSVDMQQTHSSPGIRYGIQKRKSL